jgi:Zn-dependent alcohol dehydrogenase
MQPDSIKYRSGSGDEAEACVKYFGQSSFASVMRVSQRSLTKIPADTKASVACALACGFQTGFSTVLERASRDAANTKRSFDHYTLLRSKDIKVDDVRAVKPSASANGSEPKNVFADQTLVVSGIGAVGLGALVAGEMLGFGKVIAVDINPARLDLAKRAKATDVIDATQCSTTEEFVDKVKQSSIGQRGASLFVEASGAPPALKNGIMSLAIAGKAIILGSPPPTALLDVPSGAILVRCLHSGYFVRY